MSFTFLLHIAVIINRFFLGALFFTAGVGKLLKGFPGLMGPVWLEERLAEYGLGMYAQFIAYSQVLVGFLLLSQRFATLGAVMLFPMLINILMITISQNWVGTPYVVSVFLMQNIFLLAYDFHKLKFLITEDREPLRAQPVYRKNLVLDFCWLAGAILVFAGLPFAKTQTTLAWGLVCCGLLVFVICAIWQLQDGRKSKPCKARTAAKAESSAIIKA